MQANARGRVLLAEDDDALRRLLALVLCHHGYEVVEACTGDDLVERLAGAILSMDGPDVDVLVTDLRMPGCSGLQALRGLRDAGLSLPTVLITAFGDASTRQEALALGARAVLDKPVEIDDFVSAVNAMAPWPVPPS